MIDGADVGVGAREDAVTSQMRLEELGVGAIRDALDSLSLDAEDITNCEVVAIVSVSSERDVPTTDPQVVST